MFAELIRRLIGGSASKATAKSRLHFVLVQDRTGLTSDEMASFKEEMVSVIEKYFVIDRPGFDIAYKRDGDTSTLFINSPIIVKRQEGFQHQVGAKRQPRVKSAAPESSAAENLGRDNCAVQGAAEAAAK